jgi:2-polyprenyl-6-methoxyphenol hydroxylase-like FAD-dependent oxidoreductase
MILLISMPSEFVSGPDSEPTKRPPDAAVYRFGCPIPEKDGVPPHAPPTSYIQAALNKYGPSHLSSDPAVNPKPIHITETIWSTRFRTHAAIAERFFTRSAADAGRAGDLGGVVFLVGDAAHIHSPVGGQGMNLGIRDAVGLAPVLAQHLALTESHGEDPDKILQAYADRRHKRALAIIHLTKRLQGIGISLRSTVMGRIASGILVMALSALRSIPAVRGAMAWRLSGLAAR